MIFCQLEGANSSRKICNGLSASLGKLKHPGMKGAPKRSTLSYANEHRCYTFYEKLFYTLPERYRRETALISMLIFKYMKARAKMGWSMSNLASLLRMNLLTYRDLWKWLDDPFNTPPFFHSLNS